MKKLLKGLSKGTIFETPQHIQGTVLRSSVTVPGGAGCSNMVFILEENPDYAFSVQNWAVGNHEIVFTKAGDRVCFKYVQGMYKVMLDSFENFTYRELVESQKRKNGAKPRDRSGVAS